MPKISYDGDIKIINHGDWEEWLYPSGFRYTEGNIPEDEQMEFYARYKPRASRLRHRGSPETLIALAQKRETGDAS